MKARIEVELTDDLAMALAQLCERIGWSDVRKLAKDDGEAYQMRDAIDLLGQALAEKDFAPR